MKTYNAKFTGRRVNADGIFYPIKTVVVGIDEANAEINLYSRFDHISRLELEEIDDPDIAMRTIKVAFDDAKYDYQTNINGTRGSIVEYFGHNLFNVGVFPDEVMRRPRRLEFIGNDETDSITV